MPCSSATILQPCGFHYSMKTCLLFHSLPFTLTLSRTSRLHLHIFQSLINACSCFCVYACVCVSMHVCTKMPRSMLCAFLCHSPSYFFEIESSTASGAHYLSMAKLLSKSGKQTYPTMPWIYIGPGNVNSSPHSKCDIN